MLERYGAIECDAQEAAAYAVERCAQDLLTVQTVAAHVLREWPAQARGTERPGIELLRRMALRYCSRRLYLACCSHNTAERDCAFWNLRRYLQQQLSRSKYARMLDGNAAEDVLQQTLVNLHCQFTGHPPGGPDEPAAFLKWAEIILLHNAYAFVEQEKHRATIPLDAQVEIFLEQQAPDEQPDEIAGVFTQELKDQLIRAILSLKNPRYRGVLVGLFLEGMEESELAQAMGAQVQDIYLWRHRALKALRSKQEIVEALSPWMP